MARVDDAQDAGNPRRGEASGSGRTGSSWRRPGCGQSLLLLGPVGLRLDPLVKRQTALATHRTPHGVDAGEPQQALLPRLVCLFLRGIRGLGLGRNPEKLPAALEVLRPVAVGEQPVVPDALKAVG